MFRHVFKPESSIRAETVIICLPISCPIPSVTLSVFAKCQDLHSRITKSYTGLDLINNINFDFFFNQFSINHAKATVIFLTYSMSLSYTKLLCLHPNWIFSFQPIKLSINQSIYILVCFYVSFVNIKCVLTFPFHIHSRSNPVGGQWWHLILMKSNVIFTIEIITQPWSFILLLQGSLNLSVHSQN